MSIGLTGMRTTIVREFLALVPAGEEVLDARLAGSDDCRRYLFAQGFLAGKRARDLSLAEWTDTLVGNFAQIALRADQLLSTNRHARICIIGSESGFSGSFDIAYAASKAAMHAFIEHRRLEHPGQQLVGIAPTIVENSGMTARRTDHAECMARGAEQRRGRWLRASEVARLAHFLLYCDEGAITNTVIRMHGG